MVHSELSYQAVKHVRADKFKHNNEQSFSLVLVQVCAQISLESECSGAGLISNQIQNNFLPILEFIKSVDKL